MLYLVFLAGFVCVVALTAYPIYQYLRHPVTVVEPEPEAAPSASAPTSWAVMVRKMDPHSLLGVSPEMIPKFEEMVQRVAPGSAKAQVGLGILYQYKGLHEKAVERYRKAIELDAALPDAHYRLGTAYYAMGRPTDAESEYQEAMRIQSDYLYAYYSLAALQQQRGRGEEAETLYKKIIEMKPGEYQAHNNLAIVLEERGLYEESRAEYEKAASMNPSDPVVKENLRRARQEMPGPAVVPAPEPPSEAPKKSEPSKPLPFKNIFKPKTLTAVLLKNGQRLSGEVTREDARGFWFRMDEGTDVYIGRDEVAKKIEGNT